MPKDLDRAPSYSSGATIPLSIARWFYAKPVTQINLITGSDKLRFTSGSESIEHHCSWGITLTSGKDRQGRQNLIDLTNYEEVDRIVKWEARQKAPA